MKYKCTESFGYQLDGGETVQLHVDQIVDRDNLPLQYLDWVARGWLEALSD